VRRRTVPGRRRYTVEILRRRRLARLRICSHALGSGALLIKSVGAAKRKAYWSPWIPVRREPAARAVVTARRQAAAAELRTFIRFMAQWIPFPNGAPAQTGWSRNENRFAWRRPAIDADAVLAVLLGASTNQFQHADLGGGHERICQTPQPLVEPSIPVTLKGFEETAGPLMAEIAPNGCASRRFHGELP
jgi:hypothetical protein